MYNRKIPIVFKPCLQINKMSKKLKIFVCTYNQPVWFDKDPFVPMQVGRSCSSMKFENYVGDDTGDNISYKNKYYSEQTGVYWVWKNMKDNHPDYVGFCHYRKLPLLFDSDRTELRMSHDEYLEKSGISENSILKLLKKSDVVCIKPFFYFNRSLEEFYREIHISEDYDLLSDAIRRIKPDYYPAFSYIMTQKPSGFFPYNIYIMKWERFCEYCSFIFPVFEQIEKLIDYTKHNGYQSRVFGYMTERLLTVFIVKNDLSVSPVPCAIIDEYENPDYTVQDEK